MTRLSHWLFFWAIVVPGFDCFAQGSVVLNYSGRLLVEGTPFSGTGYFMFALQNKNGEIFWSSGDFPFAGSATNPTNALKILVKDGDYTARLGASANGMPPLNLAELRRLQDPRLNIWFNDARHGWQRVGEEVPLEKSIASLDEAGKRPINAAQADAILQELHTVRNLLEGQNRGVQPAPPAPAPPTFATVGLSGPSLGRKDAPLVLVEFTDFQCPFCKKFHAEIFPELVRKYVDTGKLRMVGRNLPLPFHPNAEPAAEAALCANQQEKYWAMRERLFDKSSELTATNIWGAASAVSLDLAKFKSCLEGKTFELTVKKDGKDADAAGISGTPSFVLGKPDGDKLSGLIIVGAQPLAIFDTDIQKLLPAAN